jgi:hypothetical protein
MKKYKVNEELNKIKNNNNFTKKQKISIIIFGTTLGILLFILLFSTLTFILTFILNIEFRFEYVIIIMFFYFIFIRIIRIINGIKNRNNN